MIEPVSRTTEGAALEYLARSPYLNVFISHVLLHDPAPPDRKNVAVALAGDSVLGVAYCGRQLAIAAEPATLEAFGEYAKLHRGERMIVGSAQYGPRPLEGRLQLARRTPSRARPPVSYDARPPASPSVRTTDERAPSNSRRMARRCRQLGTDGPPRTSVRSPARFFGVWLERSPNDRTQTLVGRNARTGASASSAISVRGREQTLQLQGLWTPPELRGQGLAAASFAAICDRLLEVSPTLSLYVNDFNDAAIALYRRVGFEHVGDFQTMLF